MARKSSSSAQILLFPLPDDQLREGEDRAGVPVRVCEVVLSGSYRKDPEGLRLAYAELRDSGCEVLSPSNIEAAREVDGFVFMRGEETLTPQQLELRHLEMIQRAHFVWLHAPEGYVGPSAALEVGFARAIGVPVFARNNTADPTLNSFVQVVSSPLAVMQEVSAGGLPPPQPAIRSFQEYYRRVASRRGYERESAKDCLLLMVEEVGELARAIRKRSKLVRHGGRIDSDEAQELADVFLYVVHMANILNLDLSKAVQNKEQVNLKRFLMS